MNEELEVSENVFMHYIQHVDWVFIKVLKNPLVVFSSLSITFIGTS